MSTQSISQCKGKGSIGHNNREFYTDNIDRNRTADNIVFANQPIGEAYKELFGGAVERYNAKQKRNDRKVGDYYESLFNRPPCNTVVESACKRKSFYEDLVQVGTKDDCRCGTTNGDIAVKCLIEYMEGYKERNPNFHVFNAVLHVDEATPHLHINYIPVGHYKRGLDTQNGYNQALKEMGFTGANCFREWRERERAVLKDICTAHGLEIKPKELEQGRGHSFTVEEFKVEKDRARTEVKALEEKIEELSPQVNMIQAQCDDLALKHAQIAHKCSEEEKTLQFLTEKKTAITDEITAIESKLENFRKKSDKVKTGEHIMLDESVRYKFEDLSEELTEYLKNPIKIPFHKEKIENVFEEMKKIVKKAHKTAEKASSSAFKQWELCDRALKANKQLGKAADRVPILEKAVETLKQEVSKLKQKIKGYEYSSGKLEQFLDKKGLKQEYNTFLSEQKMLEQQAQHETQKQLKEIKHDDYKRGRSR